MVAAHETGLPVREMGGLPEPVRRLVRSIASYPSVTRVWLFGSRARGDHRPRSDVDLAVEASRATTREWIEIAHEVELAETLLPIDLVRLDEAPAELRERVHAEGRLLHER